MPEKKYEHGADLLSRPVMPLVSMVQFIFMTGPFATVREVIGEFPEPIETDRAVYEHPRAQLMEYIDVLRQYEPLKKGEGAENVVMDEEGRPVDDFTAVEALIGQQVLTRELERINSLLCAPCGCTLCCVGPEHAMQQEFFEIPLREPELEHFAVPRSESADSLRATPYDDQDLILEDRPFYATEEPGLIHWRTGWSLILPKGSVCPNLDAQSGRCLVYRQRPEVCRRPQIFPYILEPADMEQCEGNAYRIRRTLLAVVDCPYVVDLKDEIAEYAAASGLQLVLKENKG